MFKKARQVLKNNKGLTLVELLAVIVILGIISAIAVPSIGGLINKTNEDAQVAEALQIINAAKLSHASNGLQKDSNDAHTGWTNTELQQYLDSVDNTGYNVQYIDYDSDTTTPNVYVISGHPAITVVGASNSNASEEELLAYTGN